jgi:hypothetical protein
MPCLQTHLTDWLPGGVRQGDEYLALNPLRNDRRRGSFRVNLRSGRWADFAIGVKGRDVVSLYAYLNGFESQYSAADALMKEVGVAFRSVWE